MMIMITIIESASGF